MPWSAGDARRHTKKATTDSLKALWAEVANNALRNGDSEAVAIRKANAAVARAAKDMKGK